MSAARYCFGAIVVALAPVLAFAKSRLPLTSAPTAPPQEVATQRIRAEGRIVASPGAKVTVGTEESGRVKRVLVTENAQVHAGDLVAELDGELVEAELAQARTKLTEARHTQEYLARELTRSEKMVAAGLVSEKDCERARHESENAGTAVAAAEAEVERLTIVAKKTLVTAPISGVVVQLFVCPGETEAPGAPVATIVDLTRLRVEAEVDEIDAPSLGPGTPVSIAAESAPGQLWQGSVEQVPGAVVRRDLRGVETERPQDMPVLLVKIALRAPIPLRLGQEVSVFFGPEPTPAVVAASTKEPVPEPSLALIVGPVSPEALSAALTTILGTLFFLLVRRRLRRPADDEDDGDDAYVNADAAGDEVEDDHDSDEGALEGVVSEEDIIVFDDSSDAEAEAERRARKRRRSPVPSSRGP